MEEILSVGIDIGTATTQVIFSKLRLENVSSIFSAPQVNIVEKKVIYQSKIHSTTLSSYSRIDSEAIKTIVKSEYVEACIKPSDVRTGAIIVTGETALKENAEAVIKELSNLAGDFVIYTAGPDLESIIAGKGSGAQEFSIKHSCTVANLDIGGGTCNIAIFRCGELVSCGTFDIGGRLIRLDKLGMIRYISPRVMIIAEEEGIELQLGCRADLLSLKKVVERMNKVLEQALGIGNIDKLTMALKTSGSSTLKIESKVDFICFSGGVADCIRKTALDPFKYDDIGMILGMAVSEGLTKKISVIPSNETIRATVIGAGSHTINISGSTIDFDYGVLPLRNLPVLRLNNEEEDLLLDGDYESLANKMKWCIQQSNSELVVIAFKGPQNPNFEQLKRIGESIAKSSIKVLKPMLPIVIAIESDFAKALGQQIKRYEGESHPIVCLDGIKTSEYDYIDIGTPVFGGLAVPVIIKTLLFGNKGG